jgi:hypothetical protein
MSKHDDDGDFCAATLSSDSAFLRPSRVAGPFGLGIITIIMIDRSFAQWWLSRIAPFKDVPPEKLAAEREAIARQQDYNRNYAEFLNGAVLPCVDAIVKVLAKNNIVHRVSSWGNQLSIRIHLAWRWGELVIMQSHEDCVTFEHHIITEGEKRGDDSAEDHSHTYDLRDALPAMVAAQEIQFFLGRLAQDLVEAEAEPEIPPGEKPENS